MQSAARSRPVARRRRVSRQPQRWSLRLWVQQSARRWEDRCRLSARSGRERHQRYRARRRGLRQARQGDRPPDPALCTRPQSHRRNGSKDLMACRLSAVEKRRDNHPAAPARDSMSHGTRRRSPRHRRSGSFCRCRSPCRSVPNARGTQQPEESLWRKSLGSCRHRHHIQAPAHGSPGCRRNNTWACRSRRPGWVWKATRDGQAAPVRPAVSIDAPVRGRQTTMYHDEKERESS